MDFHRGHYRDGDNRVKKSSVVIVGFVGLARPSLSVYIIEVTRVCISFLFQPRVVYFTCMWPRALKHRATSNNIIYEGLLG